MSELKKIYQTLEDRDNPDDVEKEGPFLCERNSAWLGKGYYFWESFINNAHWWGKECNNYINGYIICKATYVLDEKYCFNLIDNEEHINQFSMSVDLMYEKGLCENNQNSVARVLQFLRDTLESFRQYEAIRAHSEKTRRLDSEFSKTIKFNENKKPYLNLSPLIQICFYKKNNLKFSNYKIVYPDHYIEGYVA